MEPNDSERILVLPRAPRDGEIALDELAARGLEGHLCATVDVLCQEIERGAGAALVTEEQLTPRAIEALRRVLSRQPPWSDFPLLVVGGAQRARQRSAPALAKLGNVTLLDPPLRVRTLERAARAALRARRRQYDARRAIEARDRFLAMLAHELRNPLSAIALAAQLGLRDPECAAAKMAVIERQIDHLTRLVDDLLDVARVSSGKIGLERQPLPLCEMIEETVEALAPRFAAAGITLRCATDAPITVEADRVRLEQVFSNLLTNALKYTPAGGSVEVEAISEGDTAVVTIRDTGVGIDPETLPRIFDPFAQGESTLDRSQGGLGVGLTLARTLVELHQGTIAATSEGPGKGSAFVVRLPIASATATASAPPEPTASRRRSIAIVEDNEDARMLLAEILRLDGHEVAEAEDGLAGLALIEELRPDLALVDIGLPGIDGYELARRVRAHDEDRAIVLIALSGYGQPEDVERALSAGFDQHLTKPADARAITAILAEHLPTASAASGPGSRPSLR